MESSTEGRLGLKKIPLTKWKGKTFSQISSVLQKNKNTLSSDAPVHMLLRPMPMKHYRREIATQWLVHQKSSLRYLPISSHLACNCVAHSGGVGLSPDAKVI